MVKNQVLFKLFGFVWTQVVLGAWFSDGSENGDEQTVEAVCSLFALGQRCQCRNTHVLLTFRTLSYCGAAVSDEYESGNEQTIETVFSLFVLSYPHTV